ncbi:MAG: glycosyltransferase family 2 protein [Polyangia bacterium]
MPNRVLVVIPTLNERAHVPQVLLQLVQEAPHFQDLSIAVVDGGSTDGTQAAVMEMSGQWPAIRLIHNPARIQSAAMNLAARRLGGDADVLIRCDAHATYPPDFCRRLVDTLDRVGADAVVVPMDSMGETCLQRAIAWVSNSPIGTGGAAHRGGRRSGFVDHGHHAAFRMAAFRRVGGYDESFTHNEDAELDCRQRALGGRVYLDADIRIGYRPRQTLAALARQYYRYGAGRARTARRHPGSLRLRQLAVPVHVAASLLAVAASAWWPVGLLWPALYVLALLATSLWMTARHRSACGLWAGPAAAVMHTAWGFGFLLSWLATREPRWVPKMAVQLHAEPAEGQVA